MPKFIKVSHILGKSEGKENSCKRGKYHLKVGSKKSLLSVNTQVIFIRNPNIDKKPLQQIW